MKSKFSVLIARVKFTKYSNMLMYLNMNFIRGHRGAEGRPYPLKTLELSLLIIVHGVISNIGILDLGGTEVRSGCSSEDIFLLATPPGGGAVGHHSGGGQRECR